MSRVIAAPRPGRTAGGGSRSRTPTGGTPPLGNRKLRARPGHGIELDLRAHDDDAGFERTSHEAAGDLDLVATPG